MSAYLFYNGSQQIFFRLKTLGKSFAIELVDKDGTAIMATYSSKDFAERELAAVQKFYRDTSTIKKDFVFSRDRE